MEKETQEKIEAQKAYCTAQKLPLFIPSNGMCWVCGNNIFSERGYTLEKAKSNLITDCPYCRTSFCD